jgi:hypothetical protein
VTPTSRGSGSITLSQVRKEDRSCFAGNEGHRRSMSEDLGGWDESLLSHKGRGHRPKASCRPSSEGRCVSVGTCHRPIGALESDILV